MSKYINEIIEDIKTNPLKWQVIYNGMYADGIKSGDIEIKDMGNGSIFLLWHTSVIKAAVKGAIIPTTYIDRFKLEETLKWWFRNKFSVQYNLAVRN